MVSRNIFRKNNKKSAGMLHVSQSFLLCRLLHN